MFAKLKKKIENEGGMINEGARNSPRRSESVTSLQGIGHYGRDSIASPPASVTSEDPSMRDVSTARDDLSAALQKKSDQCRKLESNVSDLAALIKDKSKTIEKLESSLKQQDEVLAQKLQEQKSDFESYRDKLVEGYQTDKIKLDQLLNTEQELTKCQSHLESKSRQCQVAEVQVEKLTDELVPLKQRLATADSDNIRLKEENSERAELITKLSKEKAAFDKRIDEMNQELTQKQSQVNSLHCRMAELEETHKNLARNYDLHKNKSGKSLQEKDDLIDTLKERVTTLEQRVADSTLSGDDQATALDTERKQMELRLLEARQQLTEIKSTWSDKIMHLEEQISHLNVKIVEDGEEHENQQRMSDHMKDGFEKQIDELKKQLEDSEKRALENFELASSKDLLYERQFSEIGNQREKEMLVAKDLETELSVRADGLEKELIQLKESTQQSQAEAESKIAYLESKEHDLKMQTENMTTEMKEIETRLKQKEEEVSSLLKEMREKETAKLGQDSALSSLEGQTRDLEVSLEKARKDRQKFEKHLRTSEDEKFGLLEKNADLYRQMESLKTSESECRQEHQRTLSLKAEADAGVKKTEAMLRQKIQALETQIEQSELSKAESGLYSSRIDEMTETISTLENQLSEKTRLVKKQEQMLKDLRQTLTRELKVQGLQGDDHSGDTNASSHLTFSSSPSSFDGHPYKPDHHHHHHHHPTSLHSSSSFPSLSSTTSSSSSSSLQQMSSSFSSSSNHLPPHHHPQSQATNSNNSHSGHTNVGFQMSAGGPPSSPATLPLESGGSSSSYHMLTALSSSVPSGASTSSLTAHTNSVKKSLEKDVNFQYLKHVVLKFMLSREAEALQLIKAVSMLLNFSTQEQQMMRDTLEWKMSWFGARPPQGRGQTSKWW